jgi:hypothetical protein
MSTITRTTWIASFTLLTSLSATTALAQSAAGTSDTDSPVLIAILIVFCLMVVGLLGHTAHRMAKLD